MLCWAREFWEAVLERGYALVQICSQPLPDGVSKYFYWRQAFRVSQWFPCLHQVLTDLPLLENYDDFVFDNEMLAQCIIFGYRIGEVSCPTKYFEEASSINFSRSVAYGFGVLNTTLKCSLQRHKIR